MGLGPAPHPEIIMLANPLQDPSTGRTTDHVRFLQLAATDHIYDADLHVNWSGRVPCFLGVVS